MNYHAASGRCIKKLCDKHGTRGRESTPVGDRFPDGYKKEVGYYSFVPPLEVQLQ